MTSTVSTSSAAPPVVIPASGNNIIVNHVQAKNPVLECVRNVGKEFGDIVADFQVGRTTGLFYLSLKYHRLHPEYIHNRIEKLGHSYNLRILLILCDVTEHKDPIRELTKSCLINNITIIVAFSVDEAGHYISTFKQFEFKSPDLIKERTEKDYYSILRSALTSIPKVNKTDVETLRSSFGNFAKISNATSDQLQNLPGFGQVKVKNIKNAFEKPFRNNATSTLASSQLSSRSRAKGKQPEGSQVASTSGTTAGSAVAGISGASSSTTTTTTAGATAPSTTTQTQGAADEEPPRPERPPRPPSPDWDIELDLDLPEDDEPAAAPSPALSPAPRPPPAPRPAFEGDGSRSGSPVEEFDIELDLN